MPIEHGWKSTSRTRVYIGHLEIATEEKLKIKQSNQITAEERKSEGYNKRCNAMCYVC